MDEIDSISIINIHMMEFDEQNSVEHNHGDTLNILNPYL